MTKPTKRSKGDDTTKRAILAATVRLLTERGGADLTMDEVARAAGCAKGLVHYHFRRKDQLIAAAAAALWDERTSAWKGAWSAEDPGAAIGSAWSLLVRDSARGVAAACAALGMRKDALVVQSVNSGRSVFRGGMTEGLDTLLDRMGLEATVPVGELGTLLTAIVEGIGLQLGSGAGREELEQAWAAFWVGLLSLTRPRSTA